MKSYLKNFFPNGLYVRRKKILGGGAVRFIAEVVLDSAMVARVRPPDKGNDESNFKIAPCDDKVKWEELK